MSVSGRTRRRSRFTVAGLVLLVGGLAWWLHVGAALAVVGLMLIGGSVPDKEGRAVVDGRWNPHRN